MSTDTVAESVLEDKFRDSYAQMARERRWSIIGGNIEAIALLALVGLVVVLLRYGFWGAGYSKFSAVQHNSSVDMLRNVPGPHLSLMESDLATQGYISLMDYKSYLQMAQEAKTLRAAKEAEQKALAAALEKNALERKEQEQQLLNAEASLEQSTVAAEARDVGDAAVATEEGAAEEAQ